MEIGIRTAIMLPIFTTLITGMSLVIGVNYFLQLNFLIKEEQRKIEALINIVNVFIETSTIHYQQMAALVANIPDIQEAIDKKDRNHLIDTFLPSFNYLRENFSLSQFHFHIPPTVSLLRLHALEYFGDDISKDRKTVVQVERTHKGTRGIEIGLGGIGLRGVEPIFYKGVYVGSVDIGGGLKIEIEQIKKAINAEVGVVVYKELLSSWHGLKDIKYSLGEWVSVYFTAQEPKLYISESSLRKASQSNELYYTENISQLGKDFIVIYNPLRDFSGKIIGYIYIVKERVSTVPEVYKTFGLNILICIIMLIIAGILTQYRMNKYVINPVVSLTKITEEISMGKTSQRVEVEGLCEELSILAKAIEKVRISMRKLLE